MEVLIKGKRDPVTGFFPKEELVPFLERLKAQQPEKPFSVMMLTLDSFRRSKFRWDTSDDTVFNYFASALRVACLKSECLLFYGENDTFFVVLPGQPSERLYRMGKMVERRLRGLPFVLGKWTVRLGFSGGIAACPADGDNAAILLENCLRAMSTAKRLGGGRVCQFSQQWHEKLKPFLLPVPVLALALILSLFLSYTPPKHAPAKKPAAALHK